MTSRRIILGLIVLIAVAFSVLAAAKLRATPKYDRVQVGMSRPEVLAILGTTEEYGLFPTRPFPHWGPQAEMWCNQEGTVWVLFDVEPPPAGEKNPQLVLTVAEKTIKPRDTQERLAWLLGWRPPYSRPILPPAWDTPSPAK